MKEVTLARALKIKNRLVREIKTLFEIVKEHNSYREDNKPNFDVQEAYTKYHQTLNKLVGVKHAIAKANGPIFGKIYTIAELKGHIQNLRGVNTKEGKETLSSYGSTPRDINYIATFKDSDIQSKIKDAESQIEALQDEVDEFNASTKIQLDV